jgi:hypothetical protein
MLRVQPLCSRTRRDCQGELPLCSRLSGEHLLLVYLQVVEQGWLCDSWFMDMTREVHRTCIRIRRSMINSILELCRTFVEGLHCFLLHSVFTNCFVVIVDMDRTCTNV